MLFGVLAGLAASASWAGANVFVQRSARAVGPFRALVWAQVVGGLAAMPFALALDRHPGAIDGATLTWGAIGAVAGVIAYASLFLASERGRLSVVVPVMSSWSVVAAALSLGVLGERVRGSQLVGAAMVVGGVLLVSRFSQAAPASDGPDHGRGDTGAGVGAGAVPPGGAGPDSAAGAGASSAAARAERRGLLIALGAALGFGVLIPAIDRLTPVAGRIGAVPLIFALDLALGIPLALVARVNLRPPPRSAWPAVAWAGLLETAGFVWISLGVARAPVALVSPLAGLSSAFTVLYAWLFLRERPSAPVLAGAALACAGVVTLSL